MYAVQKYVKCSIHITVSFKPVHLSYCLYLSPVRNCMLSCYMLISWFIYQITSNSFSGEAVFVLLVLRSNVLLEQPSEMNCSFVYIYITKFWRYKDNDTWYCVSLKLLFLRSFILCLPYYSLPRPLTSIRMVTKSFNTVLISIHRDSFSEKIQSKWCSDKLSADKEGGRGPKALRVYQTFVIYIRFLWSCLLLYHKNSST